MNATAYLLRPALFRSNLAREVPGNFVSKVSRICVTKPPSYVQCKRSFSVNTTTCSKKDVANVKQDNLPQTSFSKNAKENVKTATYGGVVIAGIGVLGVVLYSLWDEMFSGNSPQSMYQAAADKCMNHEKVQDMLGEPIKSFGEETRRGRRRHVSYMDYVDENGRKGLRVQFYLQGLRKRATAQVDARDDGTGGKMKTRFIIVTADDLQRSTVVVEDNR